MTERFFLSNQEMLVDAKGRMAICERYMRVLKKICPKNMSKIGVTVTPDRSIKLMPEPDFMAELEKWSNYDPRSTRERKLLNLSASFADLLTLDKQNRIRLSPALMSFCGITREIMVVGSMTYMQVFAKDTWTQYSNSNFEDFDEAENEQFEKAEKAAEAKKITEAEMAARAAGPQPVQLIVNAEQGKKEK